MAEYVELETPYVPARDPREFNVAERIKQNVHTMHTSNDDEVQESEMKKAINEVNARVAQVEEDMATPDPVPTSIRIKSSTTSSTKVFLITVNDSGTVTATEEVAG